MSGAESNRYLESVIARMTPGVDQRKEMASHRESIETALKAKGVVRLRETGSWSHGTALKGVSDVDYFAIMVGRKPKSSGEALETLRFWLERGLYGNLSIRIDRPAVTVHFWGLDTRVEITPAFLRDEGDYDIPDPNGTGWIPSSPSEHLDYVTEVNKKLDGRAKHLVRLIKTWKQRQQVAISSFYLEMRTAKYADGEKLIFYSMDVPRLFKCLQSQDLADMNDPTDYGRRIQSGANGFLEAGAARQQLSEAVHYSEKAEEAAAQGQSALMEFYWSRLFGQA